MPDSLKTNKASTGDTSSKILDMLASRLTEQGKSISSSSSSNLQSSIQDAINSTQRAGDMSSEALRIEGARELGFAQDRASATITGALEGQTGYARQVAALGELAQTTEKSVRDLDQRYKQLILQNDAATAQRVAELGIKKLEFQQQQEQNFYSNIFALGNLQEQALSRQQQNEQFWAEKEQKDNQFVIQMATSNYQFERNYGLSLQDMKIKEQQLEIERSRYNLSLAEYNDKKKELAKEKEFTFTKSIVANSIKNRLQEAAGKKVTKEQLLSSDFMLKMKEETGFDGSTEELASVIESAYQDVAQDKSFMSQYLGAPASPKYTSNPSVNSIIQSSSNLQKTQYDKDRGVTIQSPESYWANLFR